MSPISIKTGTSIKKNEAINLEVKDVFDFFKKAISQLPHDNLEDHGNHQLTFVNKRFHLGRLYRFNKLSDFNYGELIVSENNSYINLDITVEYKRLLLKMGVFTILFIILMLVVSGFNLEALVFPLIAGLVFSLIRILTAKSRLKLFLERTRHHLLTSR